MLIFPCWLHEHNGQKHRRQSGKPFASRLVTNLFCRCPFLSVHLSILTELPLWRQSLALQWRWGSCARRAVWILLVNLHVPEQDFNANTTCKLCLSMIPAEIPWTALHSWECWNMARTRPTHECVGLWAIASLPPAHASIPHHPPALQISTAHPQDKDYVLSQWHWKEENEAPQSLLILLLARSTIRMFSAQTPAEWLRHLVNFFGSLVQHVNPKKKMAEEATLWSSIRLAHLPLSLLHWQPSKMLPPSPLQLDDTH